MKTTNKARKVKSTFGHKEFQEDLQNEKIIRKAKNEISKKPKIFLSLINNKLKTNPIPILKPKAFLLSKVPTIPSPKIT